MCGIFMPDACKAGRLCHNTGRIKGPCARCTDLIQEAKGYVMSFFISDAWAEAAPAAPQDAGLMGFLPLIIIFVIFYFLLLRPLMKRAKDQRKMVEALSKNDEVVTTGGLLGKIVEVDDNFLTVEIADGVRVKVQKNAVTALLPKGTVKS